MEEDGFIVVQMYLQSGQNPNSMEGRGGSPI